MAKDTTYAPVPYIYQSRGLVARPIEDQAPAHTYLNMLNCFEREENSMSSRYGTQIVNRSPDGTPNGQNFLFTSPVVTLARLLFQQQSYRYGVTSAGVLFRRATDTQGPYSPLYSGLSGNPAGWLTTSTFASSQAYLFLFDSMTSIKDTGLFAAPQLIGIDPSPYTANTQPYSPLLTLVDNFAEGNSYTQSGFSSSFGYSVITTLTPFVGQQVTDFTEFVQANFTAGGVTLVAVATPVSDPSASSSFITTAFPSTATSGQPVTLSASVFGFFSFGSPGAGTITMNYSIDSGTTWVSFFSAGSINVNDNVPLTPVTISVYGLSNLDTLLVQLVVASTASGAGAGVNETQANISAISVSVTPVGLFGSLTNGMLSILSTNATINVPIVTIRSSGLSLGIYTQLKITTQAPHGLVGEAQISVYGSSNNLCDGFYTATVVNATTLTVPFLSAVTLSATGGFLMGGAPTGPAECVLQNLYSTPYPSQLSAWGFYQTVPGSATEFPVSCWTGTVATNTTATVGATITLDLSINNEVTDNDLIVCTLAVGDPASISNIRLQFDVNNSDFTASYYYKDVSPAYYQQGVQQLEDAYTTTEQQIFADTLGLITGAPPDTTTAALQPANLSTGQGAWVAALLRRGDFVAVGTAGQSGLDWSNITGWQLVITTNTVGSSTISCNGIYLQWGYGPSSFGGIGYDYRYTYLNAATLTESNGSPEQRFDPTFGYLASLAPPIFLSQAAEITGQYSTDPQVTHLRIYRRGGVANQNWYQIDQIPNLVAGGPSGGTFTYKDVIADASLAQAAPLQLDNDPPVTSSLPVPISTNLILPTTSPGNTYFALYAQQAFYVAQPSAQFVPDQIVQVGYPNNLEAVRVIAGGTGAFTAICRLKHNAGEPVNVYSLPRVACNLCANAYGQVWLAGDPNNSHYLYFSKKGYPESFSPAAYIPVGSAGQAITAIVNWRGTLFVRTTVTWWQIVGGAQPYAQPTGCQHGGSATQGWTTVDASVWFRAPDGLRDFRGAEATYMSLAIEFIYRQNPLTPLPLADPAQATRDVMAFYNNDVYTSYISLSNSGQRYRLIYSTVYSRFRIDDVQATAMLWEQDTNTFLIAKPLPSGGYVICQDQVSTQDYDDGGWVAGALTQLPIALILQPVFQDLGKPHFPKQWNVLEDDVNTQAQALATTLQFDTDAADAVVLPPAPNPVTTATRQKVERTITPTTGPASAGQQAYRMSWIHQISVTTAPIFYQENIYAAVLADYRTSYDTYWLTFGTDQSKIVKQCYFDYTAPAPLLIALYADGSELPYYTYTLPPEPSRLSVRVLFLHKKPRLWRMIVTSAAAFQLWETPAVEVKQIREGSTYSIQELPV